MAFVLAAAPAYLRNAGGRFSHPLQPGIYEAIAARVTLTLCLLAAVLLVTAFVQRARVRRFFDDLRGVGGILVEDRLPLAIITAIGALVRLRFLAQPVRTDEAATILYYVSQPAAIGYSLYGNPNNHVLNTILAHPMYVLAGDVPWALRLPNFLAGVLLIVVAYKAAEALAGARAALMAAALVAGLPCLIDYGVLLRGYTLTALCFTAALALAARARTGDEAAPAIAAGLVLGAGFLAIPLMLYGAALLFFWLAVQRRFRAATWMTIAAGVTTAVLYAPIVVISGFGSLFGRGYVTARAGRSLLWDPDDGLTGIARFLNDGLPLWLAVLLGILAVAGFARMGLARMGLARMGLARERGRLAIAIALTLAMAIRPLPFHRTWLFLAPLYAIAIASAVDRIRWRRAAAVGVAALLAGSAALTSSVYYSNEAGSFRDAEETARFLRERLQPGDTVLVSVTADMPLIYYFERQGVPLAYIGAPSRRRTYVVVDTSAGQSVPPGATVLRRMESGVVCEVYATAQP